MRPAQLETKQKYFIEVAELARHKAEELEIRLKKGEEMGADNPKEVHHEFYLTLKAEWQRQWDYHEEYTKMAAKILGDLKIAAETDEKVMEAEKIFNDKK